jgi:hypothetical protein
MKYYLSDIIPRIRKYSASLDQTAFLVDKPWVVCEEDGAYQKLIFRRDGRVHLSNDGNVTDGKWEYLPEAQSLLIDYNNGSKKLYRHSFLDEAVLALKIDGRQSATSSGYFLLANEQLIPDLNPKGYLEGKYINRRPSDAFHEISSPAESQHKKAGLKLYEYKEGIKIWQKGRDPDVGDKVSDIEEGEIEIVTTSGTSITFRIKNYTINNYYTPEDKYVIIVLGIGLLIMIIFILANT